MARSDLVVMRGEFMAVVSENLQLRRTITEKDGQLAEAARGAESLEAEIAEAARGAESLEARMGEEREEHATEIRAIRAEHATETSERDERIRQLEADKATLGGENKKLAASDRYHNNPHSPPRSGTWAAEYRRRRAAESLHARQALWRPPGRAMGHPSSTRRLETSAPNEHRYPTECGRCHSWSLSEQGAHAKQLAELKRVVV